MAQPPSPTTTVMDPRVLKLIELETRGVIKPEHQVELDTYRGQGRAPKKAGGTLTEAERTAAFLATRAAGGADTIGKVTAENPTVAKPEILGSLAGIFGQPVRNWANSDERQRVENAQLDVLDAALTLGTGAAYTREQLEGYRQSYFPQLGEGEGAVADKKARLRTLLNAAKIKAGGASPLIDQALASIEHAEVADPNADKDRLSLLDAPAAAIDVATGVRGGKLEVPVGGDVINAQTPEFRAGLTALLNEPNTTKEQILEYWDKNAPGALEKGADPKPAALATARGEDGFIENADAAVRGAADVVTLGLATRGAALADTVSNGGTYRENLDRQRGVDEYDEQVNPWARGVGQLAGALAIPSGVAGAGARAESSALAAGKTIDEAKIAARYGIAKRMGKEGAGLGAAYGFNSEYGDWGDKAASGLKGLAAGGAVGYGLGRLVGAVPTRNGTPPTGGRAQDAAELAEASADLDIDLMPADAGGPITRMMTTVAASTPGGIQPVVSAAQRTQKQSAAALGRMAAKEGEVLDVEAAGEAVRDGALAYRGSSRSAIGKDYARAAELAGDARVEPKGAIAKLDEEIAALEEIPGGASGLSVLKSLRDDLAQRGTVTIQGIRGMRTQLRDQFFKDGLRGSDLERRVNGVVDAASDDLVASLRAAGKEEAANVYAAADKAWAQRIKTLDEVIMPIIGKKGEKSGEQIIAGINAAAKGNNARLVKLFDALPEAEAGNARATLIDGLGKANPGEQGAKGDAFSLDQFLTNWNKLGPSAKNAFFQGENRKAIDQLALIAEKSKAAGRFKNYSNTGLVMSGIVSSASALGGMATLGKTLVAEYAVGRLLASPRVARAFLNIAKASNPQAARTRIQGLSAVAAKDPTVREPLIALQQKLMEAINDNASAGGRAAASEEAGQNQQERP